MRPEDLPEETKLIQLAEELSEASQAALKMIRALRGDTPVSERDARDHLLEELADVKVCAGVLTTRADDTKIRNIAAQKYRRWERRLNDGIIL